MLPIDSRNTVSGTPSTSVSGGGNVVEEFHDNSWRGAGVPLTLSRLVDCVAGLLGDGSQLQLRRRNSCARIILTQPSTLGMATLAHPLKKSLFPICCF
jgi:hypothetical protein